MKNSTIGGITALLLAGAITVTAGIGSAVNGKWFQNSDISTWFDNWGQNEIDTPVDEKPNDNVEVSELENINGISLVSTLLPTSAYAAYGVSATSDSAYILTASISPADADNKLVDWSIAWSNPSSSWANGKSISNYLTISPSSDGALSATLECKQAFGEPALVKIVSRDNASATATAKVDYKQKVISYTYGLQTDSGVINPLNGDAVPLTSNLRSVFDYELSIGTLSDPSVSANVTIGLHSSFISWLENSYGTSWGTGYTSTVNATGSFSFEVFDFDAVSDFSTLLSPTNGGTVWGSSYEEACYQEIITWMKANYSGNVFTYTVTVNGISTTQSCKAQFPPVSVSSVSVNTASIVF